MKLTILERIKHKDDEKIKEFVDYYARKMQVIDQKNNDMYKKGHWFPLKPNEYQKYKKWEKKINNMSKYYYFRFFHNEFYVVRKFNEK